MSVYNLVVTGVGGQGIITASALLARAAIASGLDVRMYGSYGMAQRGGSVSAQVRIGDNVLNARIEKGGADLVLSLDLVEAVRWAPHIAKGGRLVTSGALVPPTGKVLRDGGAKYIGFLKSLPGTTILGSLKLSGEAGTRGENAVLLGAATAVEGFPVKAPAIEERLKEEFGKTAGPALSAFRRGADAMRKYDVRLLSQSSTTVKRKRCRQ
jgi:indolepyruvate ferredoxin oxidoreductase beta subunit